MNLRIPGPVPLPDEVLELVGSQMIDHRGPEFAVMLDRMTRNLKAILATAADAFFLTSSGTGAMEAGVVNTLSPGDRVLSISIGVFGDRYGLIAEAYGAEVTRLKYALGQAADPDDVRRILRDAPGCAAVVLTHSESSTGVANPLEAIARAVHDESDALILVDAVSSAAAIPIATDAWGIDVVATAAQKAWVAPPGIAMISFSDRAWKAYEAAKMPRFYFDVAQYRQYLQIGQPPFTPCLPAIYALDHSMQAIVDEGIEAAFARHHERAEQARDGVAALGLELLPERSVASDTVTAVKVPQGIDGRELVRRVREEHGVVLGGGQQALAGRIFRIGHMGWVERHHIDGALRAVAKTLAAMRS
ncbi:MAG: alanine--glyoxylate aminotransferase family protein [Gemmatimonadetes bacterium]|nr:alanine--glyoxylate aminotransferase family protein [Gemmatimonadota bacterium]